MKKQRVVKRLCQKPIPDTLAGLFFRDIKDIPVMTRKEETEIARRARAGDEEARNMLVERNLRFMVSVAVGFKDRGLPMADLISAGTEGFMEAAVRFDPEMGFKFITYAVWWIRQSILKVLAVESRTVRVPMNKMNEMTRLSKRISSGEVTIDGKMVRVAGMSLTAMEEEEIMALVRASHRDHVSLDNFRFDSDETGLGLLESNSPFPDEKVASDEDHEFLKEILNRCLDKREFVIIINYFGLFGRKPMTLEAIGGNLMHLTRERTRQLRDRGLRKLRGHLSVRGINLLDLVSN